MSKTVIIINEECHGFIGVAKNMREAFKFLLDFNWINGKTEIFEPHSNDEFTYLDDIREEFDYDNLLDTLLFLWNCDESYFEGQFYFSEENVYGNN